MPNAAAENTVEKIPAKLICESCGAIFTCGAKIGECWCFAVDLPPQTLTDLSKRFKDCLCENCLIKQQRDISEENNLAVNEND